MRLRVTVIFVECVKKEEFLIVCILGMVEGIFFKFGMWLQLSGGHSLSKFSAIWIRYLGAMDA